MKFIVVLGCAFRNGRSTEELFGRVKTAMSYSLIYNPEYVILSGGYTSKETLKSESQAMKDIMDSEFQTNKCKVVLEEKSRTTIENAVYVREIVEKMTDNFEMSLVTSCYHITRSLKIFREVFNNSLIFAGNCYYCKPERLEIEYQNLKRDTQILDQVDWRNKKWIEEYGDIARTIFK